MPKAPRYAIYAGDPLQNVLSGHLTHRSGRVNEVCARYLQIVADQSPEWPLAKWSAVLHTLKGYWLHDSACARLAWARIADCTGLGEKWGVDQEALAKEVREMSSTQRIALLEIVERYWQRSDIGSVAALKMAGAKVAE